MATRRYTLPVAIRQTAATSAGELVWAATNTSAAVVVKVKGICLAVGFDGTGAATTSRYDLCRYRSTGNATGAPEGGTVLAEISKRGDGGTTFSIGDSRYLDTGLDVADAVGPPIWSTAFDTPLAYCGHPRRAGSIPFEWEELIEIKPGDGLGIRLGATAVIGDSLRGLVYFEEA